MVDLAFRTTIIVALILLDGLFAMPYNRLGLFSQDPPRAACRVCVLSLLTQQRECRLPCRFSHALRCYDEVAVIFVSVGYPALPVQVLHYR